MRLLVACGFGLSRMWKIASLFCACPTEVYLIHHGSTPAPEPPPVVDITYADYSAEVEELSPPVAREKPSNPWYDVADYYCSMQKGIGAYAHEHAERVQAEARMSYAYRLNSPDGFIKVSVCGIPLYVFVGC